MRIVYDENNSRLISRLFLVVSVGNKEVFIKRSIFPQLNRGVHQCKVQLGQVESTIDESELNRKNSQLHRS